MARPQKEINWEEVERRIEAGCEAKEIWPIYGVNNDTFYRRFKEEYGFSFQDYKPLAYDVGNGNIRFSQYIRALKGNVPLLIMLGKERLGQGKYDLLISPNQINIDNEHKIMILQDEIAKLRSKLGENKRETEPELPGSNA